MARRRSPARGLLASLVAMALVGALAPAGARAAWTAPVTLSAAGQAVAPQVTVDADGDAVFTWELFDGTDSRIQARRRGAAGALGPVQTLSAAGQDAHDPQVAIDGAGNAIFTWERFDGSDPPPGRVCCWRVQARTRSAAGALGSVQTLSDAGQHAFDPQVAVDGNGNAIFTWRRLDGSDPLPPPVCCDRVQARKRSGAGTLGPVQTLSAAGQHAIDPQVAVDGAGNAIFTWERFDGTDPGSCCVRIQARRRAAGGALGSILTLSAAGQNADTPQVGVNGAGNAVFTWLRTDLTGNIIQARARSAAGGLSPIQNLSAAGQHAYRGPQVGVDDAGIALFTWTRNDGSSEDPVCCQRVQVRRRGAGGALGSIVTLSAAGQDAGASQVAVEGDGDAVFTWARFDGSDPGFCCPRIQARTRSASGTLGSTQTLSAAGTDGTSPQVDIDDAGHAVATWVRSSPMFDDFDIQAAAGP